MKTGYRVKNHGGLHIIMIYPIKCNILLGFGIFTPPFWEKLNHADLLIFLILQLMDRIIHFPITCFINN